MSVKCRNYILLKVFFSHVRIEKGPVQTVAIKLEEAHNSLEYIICLNINICTHGNY